MSLQSLNLITEVRRLASLSSTRLLANGLVRYVLYHSLCLCRSLNYDKCSTLKPNLILCFCFDFGFVGSLSHSECSSPSLITPPQSPLNLETSSFASSQSQNSLSTLPRISISPVSAGERRKDR